MKLISAARRYIVMSRTVVVVGVVCGGGGGIVNTRLGDVNVNMLHNRQHIACSVQYNITRPRPYTRRLLWGEAERRRNVEETRRTRI